MRPRRGRTGRRRRLSRRRRVPARTLGLLAGAALALGVLVVVSGCAREGLARPLPSACSAGRDRVIEALKAAPRPVRLDGAPLSACFARRTTGGDLQAVGASFVEAASTLSNQAARRPEGPAARRLGYLVGAAERGAGGVGAPGTNTEVVRRLELELDGVDPGSRALADGLRAGRASG
jgi:hypothetical protein